MPLYKQFLHHTTSGISIVEILPRTTFTGVLTLTLFGIDAQGVDGVAELHAAR